MASTGTANTPADYLTGARGIQFVFKLRGSTKTVQVVFDFARQPQWAGASYQRLESAALASVGRAGYDVELWNHYRIG